jgi:hypothetical protein
MGIILGCAPLCWAAEPSTPYAGQEQREIKALSAEEIEGYLSGSGMGLAKATELNHYPGPRHVLDLVVPLQLSEEQRQQTQAIFEAMRTEAVPWAPNSWRGNASTIPCSPQVPFQRHRSSSL